MKYFVLCLTFLLTPFTQVNSTALPKVPANPQKVRMIGNILKDALERYHYRKLKINNSLSQKAFVEFFKKLDYGKQFFIQPDLNTLKAYEFKMDDEMLSGDLKLVKSVEKILEARIKLINQYSNDILKKPFNFNKSEGIELDPDKREFAKTNSELKERWRKILKHATLMRYLSLVEQQVYEKEGKGKDGKKIKKVKNAKVKKVKKGKKSDKLVGLSTKQLRKKAQEGIKKKYTKFFKRLEKDTDEDYLEKFYNSIATIFDPHTNYLPPKRKEDFDIDISGSLEGIGAVLQEDGAFIKVNTIVPGGAASRQGELEVDDKIIMVGEGNKEPVDIVDMRVDDAVRYIRGKKGTEVRLTVQKIDGSKKVIPIIRDIVQIGASFTKSSVLQHKKLGKKIGYILVPKFYRDFGKDGARNCSNDVRIELERLKKQGIEGVILDLRNNGGGALEDAKIMSGLFIKKGPIVQIKNHDGKVKVMEDTDASVVYDGPLIVLTNRFSASASEILAGALQDYERAVIMGSQFSHGKGTVQAVLNLSQGPLLSMFGANLGALKVTIQKFYRVSGNSTQYKGVTPNIFLPDPYSYSKNREQDLDYSLPWDQVKPLKYEKWTKNYFDLKTLKIESAKRISKSKKFKKLQESINFLKKRADDTVASLNVAVVKKRNAESKAFANKLKEEIANKDVIVTNFENSLKSAEKVKKVDYKKWKKEFEKRKEKWVEGLQKDIGLEESLYVMNDMVAANKKAKLASKSKTK